MKWIYRIFAIVAMSAFCFDTADVIAAEISATESRTVVNMNRDWHFRYGDMPVAEARPDNGEWQIVHLPHDFQISQPWVEPDASERANLKDNANNTKSRLSARGFKEMGVGWYCKVFVPDSSMLGKRVLLDFEGIMLVGDVYLNGIRVGGTDYGYLGFECDISKQIKIGKENVIAVRADTREPKNSRWYTGGGLYRDVHLVVTDAKEHFARHPLYITTPEVSESNATVSVKAEITHRGKEDSIRVAYVIKDPDWKEVVRGVSVVKTNRKWRTREYDIAEINIANPLLWNCETPHLYSIELSLLKADGGIYDQVSSTFGIRQVEYSPEYGLRLNGKKVLLKGIANHHTLGALGAAAYPRAIEKRIRMLKEWGVNHIRTSHNPYSTSLLRLCDMYGILVVDELYDKWLTQYAGGRKEWTALWQHDIPEFIRRDRNHPSVIMWSLGNELQQYSSLPFNDWGVTAYHLQRMLLSRYDDTRLVTVAMHPRYRSLETDSIPAPLALETDIASYNYRYMYFPTDAKRNPKMIFYQSEASTNNIGTNYYGMNLDKVVGLAYWGMIDYLGESQGWPAKGWAQGMFDISLEPKPIAWLMRSMFKDEPIVHVAVVDNGQEDNTWNGIQVGTERLSSHWNRKPGTSLSLYTYTNADEVELLVNGRSMGRKANDKHDAGKRNRVRWDNIPYKSGYVEAVAITGGKEVARHKVETTGKASRLKVVADGHPWYAGGADIKHVRVVATDRKGRRVHNADDVVTFSVEGDAEIIAVSNGDITSDELSSQNHIRLFNGSAMVILRSGMSPGEIKLSVSSKGLGEKAIILSCE